MPTTGLREIESRLAAALADPLPGAGAQARMAPRPRHGWKPGELPAGTRDAAALLLLYERVGSTHLLLTLRRHDLTAHAGQVSLPGGGVEPGESRVQAARREAHEEVGLDPRAVHVVGRLTPLHIPASGFLLHPIVATTVPDPALRAAEAEVERILEVPLTLLADPRILRVETWELRRQPVDVPFFDVEGLSVWGATAMVLAELLAVLGAPPDPWAHHESDPEQVVP